MWQPSSDQALDFLKHKKKNKNNSKTEQKRTIQRKWRKRNMSINETVKR